MNRIWGNWVWLLAALLVLAACGGDVADEGETDQPVAVTEAPPTSAPADSTSTTQATTSSEGPDCGDVFPVFYPGITPVEGEEKGEGIRIWREDEFGLVIEARWPVPAPPDPVDASDGVIDSRIIDNGSVLTIDVGGEAGCDLMEVTFTGDNLEPLVDYQLSFVQDIRPVAELEAFLNPEEPDLPPVPAEPAYRVVAEFLEAAGDGQWDIASTLLFNEGIGEAVENALGLTPENWDEAPSRLEEYCARALCAAPYELTAIERDGPWIRSVAVELQSDDGPVVWNARLGQFEGIFSLLSLPPEGSGPDRASLSQRLFGAGETFSAIWYDAVQFHNPTGTQWSRWWRARFGQAEVLNRWGITSYAGGVSIDDLVGEFEPEFIEFDDVPYVGTGVIGGREVVYLGADNILLELDVAGLDVEPKLETSNPEAFVGTATAAGETVAMLAGIGDSLWVEFYDVDLNPISTTEDDGSVYTWVDLDPTGAIAAVAVETELHVVNGVALVDVATGEQMESWGFPPELGNVADVSFNGRYLFAPIYPSGDEPPQAFVVDTISGVGSIVSPVPTIGF